MKYTSLILSQARGSAGGATFSANKGGAFIRAKVKGTNPNTAAQTAQRAMFSAIASEWRNLGDDQRAEWEAATPYFPYQDALGQTKNYSGSQLFNALNGGIRSANPAAALLDTPPAPHALAAMTVTTFTLESDGTDLTSSFVTSPTTVQTGCRMKIYITDPLSAGISKPPKSAFKLRLNLAAAANVETAVEGYFTSLQGVQATTKIHVRAVLISTISGQMTTVFSTAALVQEA